jgi:hypothetical protein
MFTLLINYIEMLYTQFTKAKITKAFLKREAWSFNISNTFFYYYNSDSYNFTKVMCNKEVIDTKIKKAKNNLLNK